MSNIEERLVDLVNLASPHQDGEEKVLHYHRIKKSIKNNRLLDNFFGHILAPIGLVAVNLEGTRIACGNPTLEIWAFNYDGNEDTEIGDDKVKDTSENIKSYNQVTPERIWTCKTAAPIEYIKYSPDGLLFCTGSRSDKRVKIWYEMDKQYSFIYLNHPAPVTGIEWRRTSQSPEVIKTFITASRPIRNALITSCQDNRVRLWIQTLLQPGRGQTHFYLAAVIEAESAHFINNKESLLQDILARTLKNDDPESLIDHFDDILDSALKEWRSVPDIVFGINKSDGSLKVWQVKYLDGDEIGLNRQVQITDLKSIDKALPIHDATTLSSNVTTYFQSTEQSNVFLLTQHLSGSLGLWKLNLDCGVDLVTRITGLPISPMWLKDGMLSIEYDNEEEKLTTNWTPDGADPVEVDEIKNFDGERNQYRASRLSSNIKILPQYHIKQLVELLAFGKLQRVKAILNQLVSSLTSSSHQQTKSHRSRTLSIVTQSHSESLDLDNTESALHDPILEEVVLDYVEITSIKPLPLYLLFKSDTEKPNSGEPKGHDEFSATFDSIYQSKVEETLDEILGKSTLQTINEQKLASEPGKDRLTNFNPRKAKSLTKILTHTRLPGLSNTEQMHLLAVADALAFFDASPDDFNQLQEEEANYDHQLSVNIAIDSLDDRGLRFLTATRQYVYLSKYLPMNQRNELRERGIGSHNIVWAFHSETQEELIGLIPCVQRNKPNWLELREFGVGWWVKKIELLRKLIEKVAQSAYQARQDPLDAALFYLAMKKKTLVCALLRRVNCDKRLLKLFEQDFNDPVNRKKALKNAYALLGLHRFEHAAAFFLLAGSIWDAVEVCKNNLNDIQLAIVLIRLYDTSPNLRRLLFTEILGSKQTVEEPHQNQSSPTTTTTTTTTTTPPVPPTANDQYQYDPKRAHKDPFLRSMAFWKMGDYLSAVHTLLEEDHVGGDTNVSASVFNFYRFLKDQPLVSKHKRQLMEEQEIKRRASPIEEEQLHFHRARSLSSGQLGFEGVKRSGAVKQSSTEYEVLNESTHLVDKYSDEAVADKERRLFFLTAQTYLESGCPMLTLEVLGSEDHLNMSQAQRMKFIACLHILLNELNTLAHDHMGEGKQIFKEIFDEWLDHNIEDLRKICSYSGSEEPILHTMLTYCSLHIAAEESLIMVREQLLARCTESPDSEASKAPTTTTSTTTTINEANT